MDVKSIRIDDPTGWDGMYNLHPFTKDQLTVGDDDIVSIRIEDKWCLVTMKTDEPQSILSIGPATKTYGIKVTAVKYFTA